MKLGSLFAGIGGFDLGFEWAGFETAWQVEKDEFCRKVLTKHWPNVPKYEDIYDFIEKIKQGTVEPVDVITGGFPCQPFSQAGKRKGAQDDRYLWPAMVEVISLLRSTWVIGENVAGILNMGFENMLSELEDKGYRTESFIIPACAVAAPHRRDRVWIVAYNIRRATQLQREATVMVEPQGQVKEERHKWERSRDAFGRCSEAMPNNGLWESMELSRGIETCWDGLGNGCRWKPEPNVGRVAHGIPRRVDRLRALGNAVVPQIPYIIGQAIMQQERGEQCPG